MSRRSSRGGSLEKIWSPSLLSGENDSFPLRLHCLLWCPFGSPPPRITEGDPVVRADAHITGQEKLDSSLRYEFNQVNDVRISAKTLCDMCICSALYCADSIAIEIAVMRKIAIIIAA